MKEIKHSKIEYLELLLENDDGITPKEVEELFFDDVTPAANRHALRRLFKQGCTTREKEGLEFRYWITQKGIRKYDYLLRNPKKGKNERKANSMC